MLLETQAAGSNGMNVRPGANLRPIAWALLLPGALGLGGLAFGGRRRAWLNRMALVALVGVVMSIGMTGCSPLYRYYNHGPGQPPATPAGTYNIIITAESNNGVTSISSTTTLVLTVK
jgi:hypothetical protein